MSKKTKISQEDLKTFYDAVSGTKPLANKHKKVRLRPTAKQINKPPSPSDFETVNLNEESDIEKVMGESFLVYKHPSISNKILRKLRKGQYNVDAKLDLHGMSVEEARIALMDFLKECIHLGVQVALIVHGKANRSNSPILKNKLNLWLRKTNLVLAFCSASARHGSRGAVYVLLKRKWEDHFIG